MADEISKASTQVDPEVEADTSVVPDGSKTERDGVKGEGLDVTPKAKAQADGKTVLAKPEGGLKLKEGALLDQTDVDRISAFAKEKGLTTEQAQDVLDREEQGAAAYHTKQLKEVDDARASWIKAAGADKEFGGDGFKQNAELAKRVVDKFGSEAFKKALNDTGFGNHPEVIRTFVRIGKMMADDQFVQPKSQSGTGKKPIEEVFYPTTAQTN